MFGAFSLLKIVLKSLRGKSVTERFIWTTPNGNERKKRKLSIIINDLVLPPNILRHT